MNTRGQKRLCCITYGLIADWTGLTEGSIRNAAYRKQFTPKDIESVLCWVNSRRARKGMPPIGQPIETREGTGNGTMGDVENELLREGATHRALLGCFKGE